jgi:hypothetical protein
VPAFGQGITLNLEDAILTHEIVFAAQECYRTHSPVKLPLLAAQAGWAG